VFVAQGLEDAGFVVPVGYGAGFVPAHQRSQVLRADGLEVDFAAQGLFFAGMAADLAAGLSVRFRRQPLQHGGISEANRISENLLQWHQHGPP
jgi:hypothetical protein